MTKEQREALKKIVELYNAGPICPRCEDRYPLSTKEMGNKLKCEVCGEDIIYGSEVADRLFESEVEKAKKEENIKVKKELLLSMGVEKVLVLTDELIEDLWTKITRENLSNVLRAEVMEKAS